MDFWVNNIPIFNDNRTHGVIYAKIRQKLHKSSPQLMHKHNHIMTGNEALKHQIKTYLFKYANIYYICIKHT